MQDGSRLDWKWYRVGNGVGLAGGPKGGTGEETDDLLDDISCLMSMHLCAMTLIQAPKGWWHPDLHDKLTARRPPVRQLDSHAVRVG